MYHLLKFKKISKKSNFIASNKDCSFKVVRYMISCVVVFFFLSSDRHFKEVSFEFILGGKLEVLLRLRERCKTPAIFVIRIRRTSAKAPTSLLVAFIMRLT